MEILTTREEQFKEILKIFDPKKVPFPEYSDLLLYYYYNLDYTGKKEEEHKLEAWSNWMENIYERDRKLFMTIDDLIVSLAYSVEDENKLKPIIKSLKQRKKLVSSGNILEGIGAYF